MLPHAPGDSPSSVACRTLGSVLKPTACTRNGAGTAVKAPSRVTARLAGWLLMMFVCGVVGGFAQSPRLLVAWLLWAGK
jgi:hypothetical protein